MKMRHKHQIKQGASALMINSELEFDEQTNLLRLAEAVLFAALEPLDNASIGAQLPEGSDVGVVLEELRKLYSSRGVNLINIGGKWTMRTAPDLADRLKIERTSQRRLSRAAHETLAVVAYHQPITRAEIEEIRGVSLSKGTMDVLLEVDWIRPGRRRNSPGRPLTWGTTEGFLSHFGIENLKDLPGIQELKAAGLIDQRPAVNIYSASADRDELPLEPITGEDERGPEMVEPLEVDGVDFTEDVETETGT